MTAFIRGLTIALGVVSAVRVDAQVDERPLKLVQEMRISGVDEDLSSTSSTLIVLPKGVVGLFDDVNVRFVYFDSAGKRIGTFGRKGSGPGEFRSSGQFISPGGARRDSYSLLTGTVGDSMWVYDRNQRRFSIIAPDRKLVRTFVEPIFDPKTAASFSPLALYAGDRLLGQVMIGSYVEVTESDGDKDKHWTYTDSALFIASKDAALQRRIANLPSNNAIAVHRRIGAWSSAAIPFGFTPLRDVAQDGSGVVYVTRTIASANGGNVRVAVISPSGDTLLAKYYPYTAPPVTKRRADSAYAAVEKHLRTNMGRTSDATNDLLRQIREGIPTVEAPFTSVLLGLDGSVWLRLPRGTRDAAEYLAIDDKGNVLGTVRIPGQRNAISLREATRTHIWVTERDEDGFSSIVRYRITT